MAENNDLLTPTENVVTNADIPVWQSGLAGAVNDTYSYGNNSLFYALMPTYYRDYAWRYIRVACQWLDGYVWSLHQSGISGIMSTRIASKLITGLTKQIVGEKLIYKVDSKDMQEVKDTLYFVSKWADKQNIIKSVYSAIGFALGIGTSLIKINKTSSGELWWEAVRFDSCYYMATFKNEIKEATFLIRNYVDTREGYNNQQFFLVEHRYWKEYQPEMIKKLDGTIEVIHKKGEKEAVVTYEIHRCNGTVMNNVMPTHLSSNKLNWEEIPSDIRKMIKHDYGAYKINEELTLGLTDLGVVPLLNAEIDLSVPTGTNFGESMIVGIQDDLITYELASSYLIRDMYLGKGTVYVPKSLNLGDLQGQYETARGGVLNGIGENRYETIKGVSPEEQQVIVQQFNLRVQEWQTIKENALKNIAVKWGMSPKILSSFLATGQAQMTATQVDSEDDVSIAFISHTRAYFKDALNKLLEITLNYYGYPANVTIDFASPSLVNKDRILDRTIKELQEGLIDLDEAIRILNPDLDEVALQAKIESAKMQRDQMMMAQFNEMNQDGTFGAENNYEDMGGENLNGSTAPIQ